MLLNQLFMDIMHVYKPIYTATLDKRWSDFGKDYYIKLVIKLVIVIVITI